MTPRVSVIIPFLNAARFLAETIESVLAQELEDWELLLVDDGSTDASGEIARSYASRDETRIRVLEHTGHANLGVCASRNVGVANARGEYVALLDADDVWLPSKLREQVAILDAHPSVEMVYGHSKYWRSWKRAAGGTGADYTPELGVELDRVYEPPRLALALYPLAKATAPCPSDLLLRRRLVERIGGFEERFHKEYQLYEDQAFLSKVYLEAAVFVSSKTWDLYRIHPESCDATVIRSGRYAAVRRFFLEWLEDHYERHRVEDPRLRSLLARALFPYRHPLLHRVRTLGLGDVRKGMRERLERSRIPAVGRVRLGSLRRTEPISRRFGFDRGVPIDRYYIERFLERHELAILGRVLEVGDSTYTRKFGSDRVTRRDVLNVGPGGAETTIVADLASASAIPSESFDCIIVTQTLQYVWDVPSAVRTLHRILAPGGVLLATFPGITPIVEVSFGDSWYWSLTRASARKLFAEAFGSESVDVSSEGNVLATVGFLHGLAAEELPRAALGRRDPSYQLLITVRATKPPRPLGGGRSVEALSFPPLSSVVPASITSPRPGDLVERDLVVEGSIAADRLGSDAVVEARSGQELLGRVSPVSEDGEASFSLTVPAGPAANGRIELGLVQGAATVELATVHLGRQPEAPPPLVSIVIPCFDHAAFLAEAIESALGQTYRGVEVIVVDDGSTDDSFEVASRKPGVRVLRQSNRGLSAARNAGLKASRGEYLLFLDADDRLLPGAVAASVRAAREHPECAFVFGRFHVINRRGARLLSSELPEFPAGAYAALLNRNWIVMHGTVLYRRRTFEEVGLFDTSLRASEDYDLYLRVSRRFPIAAHSAEVAEVRKHGSNMTQDMPRMLRYTLAALGHQWPHAKNDPDLRREYLKGVAFWKDWYGEKLATQLKVARFERRWASVRLGILSLVRHRPKGLLEVLARARRSNAIDFVVSEAAPAAATRPASGSRTLELLKLGTSWTKPGQPFNVQPNGESALWVECENASVKTRIVFGGVPLETHFGRPSLLTALVPFELIEKPGRHPVYLLE
jgi:glycosyltransferase involved in cell wall biosynthesis